MRLGWRRVWEIYVRALRESFTWEIYMSCSYSSALNGMIADGRG